MLTGPLLILVRPQVLAWAALLLLAILTPLRVIRILLTLLPLLGILLFVRLFLFGFGSRHCVPPSLVETQPNRESVQVNEERNCDAKVTLATFRRGRAWDDREPTFR